MRLWRSFHSPFYPQMASGLRVSDKARWILGVRLSRELQNAGSVLHQRNKRPLRYSGCIMTGHLQGALIDPIGLTRQLCEIESTTYKEGAVGDFLADFLAGRGWEVEKTPVPQPGENAHGRRTLECVCDGAGGEAGCGVFDPHGHGTAVHSFYRGRRVHVWPRGVGCKGDYCDTDSGCGGVAGGGVPDWHALRERGRARLCGGAGSEQESQGQPVSDQWRADGQRLGLASKGALRASLKSTGKMAHSAYPELGDGAIHKMIEALTG